MEIIHHHSGAFFAADSGLGNILPNELLLHLRISEGFRRQIGEIHHLRTVFTQQVAEGVVLLLCDFQIGYVVEQQPLDIFRHQIFQLPAGAVQKYPFQWANLAVNVNGRWGHAITPFFPSKISRKENFYTKKGRRPGISRGGGKVFGFTCWESPESDQRRSGWDP